jgi:hypothetical protein
VRRDIALIIVRRDIALIIVRPDIAFIIVRRTVDNECKWGKVITEKQREKERKLKMWCVQLQCKLHSYVS